MRTLTQIQNKVFNGSLRFILPLIIVLTAKFVAILWLYFRLSGEPYYTIRLIQTNYTSWLNQNTDFGFLRLFVSWDSGFFVRAVREGYATPYLAPPSKLANFAFFPGYPLLIYLFYLITGNYVLSAVIPAFVFGIMWIPFFQAIAEHYMPRTEALYCTLTIAFFPIVFVFTSVAYSEPLFLFATVACWYFYLKEKILYSGLLAAVASISRIYGIFIGVPLLLDLLRQRKWKLALLASCPSFLALFGWFSYCYVETGDWLVSWHMTSTWGQTNYFKQWIMPLFSVNSALPVFSSQFEYMIFIVIFISLFVFLTLRTWENDWRLTVYSSLFSFIILFGGMESLPRFLPFIFPIWLSTRIKKITPLIFCAIFFYLSALLIWYQFLMFGWVG